MQRRRVRDLGITIYSDGSFLVRAPSRGVAARVPMHAVELLAFCSEPRARGEALGRFGPAGERLYDALAEAGLLVAPHEADDTPVMFENFASIDVHRRMLADRARLDAYARALASTVKPGMSVLDAGTGSGVLAALAARAGARVVYAVDNSDMIEVAAEVCRASGLGDRVRVLRGDFGSMELPERVDLVVTETFGAMAVAEGGVDDVAACCRRHLRPGGTTIPSAVSFHLAPVADAAALAEAVGPFAPFEGVDLGVLRPTAMRRGIGMVLRPEQLAHPGGVFARVPFPGEARAAGALALEGQAPVTAVGFAGWFSLHLAPGFDLPTGPADPSTHWRQQFLPAEPFEIGPRFEVEAGITPALDDRRAAEILVRWRSEDGEGEGAWRLR